MSQRAEEFHASPWIGTLFVTGGGSGLIEEMLATPGASASILEVQVPYAQTALTQLLGRAPEQACSVTTARQLAMAAYERATVLGADEYNFGLGCTASLATNRTKRGQHRAHWALQTHNTTATFSVVFNADRAAEERALVDYIWQSIAYALLGADEPTALDVDTYTATTDELGLYQPSPIRHCIGHHDGKLLLPGSFNPIHDGHLGMLSVAEELTGLTGAFEMTVNNADKPSLDYIGLRDRLAQFSGARPSPLWLTNVATYAEKAQLFPGATFVLGVDTLARVAQLKFYDHRAEQFAAALDTFARQEVRFLVFGREQERYITLSDLDLPEALRTLCDEVSEDQFRMDISSTLLRQAST